MHHLASESLTSAWEGTEEERRGGIWNQRLSLGFTVIVSDCGEDAVACFLSSGTVTYDGRAVPGRNPSGTEALVGRRLRGHSIFPLGTKFKPNVSLK